MACITTVSPACHDRSFGRGHGAPDHVDVRICPRGGARRHGAVPDASPRNIHRVAMAPTGSPPTSARSSSRVPDGPTGLPAVGPVVRRHQPTARAQDRQRSPRAAPPSQRLSAASDVAPAFPARSRAQPQNTAPDTQASPRERSGVQNNSQAPLRSTSPLEQSPTVQRGPRRAAHALSTWTTHLHIKEGIKHPRRPPPGIISARSPKSASAMAPTKARSKSQMYTPAPIKDSGRGPAAVNERPGSASRQSSKGHVADLGNRGTQASDRQFRQRVKDHAHISRLLKEQAPCHRRPPRIPRWIHPPPAFRTSPEQAVVARS